jgi:hypothetical protein
MLHDFRRSAIRNLTNAGVPQRTCMEISGHKTVNVFNRYNIVSKENVLNAMQQVVNAELHANGSKVLNGSSLGMSSPVSGRRKALNPAQSSTGA